MRMEEIPEQLTPAQQEARQILDQLLSNLKQPDSIYYERYGPWAEKHPKLGDFCVSLVQLIPLIHHQDMGVKCPSGVADSFRPVQFTCVRPNVWRFLQGGTWNLDGYVSVRYICMPSFSI
jgi:hypothetical protein